MKRKLKEFVLWSLTIIFIFFGCLYYLNFEAEGDVGFVATRQATIYQAPRYSSDTISTLDVGDSLTIISNGPVGSTHFVKVRLEEPDKRPKIGYVPETSLGKYEFPAFYSGYPAELILCDRDISLDEFVPEFNKAIKSRRIVGVYLDHTSVESVNQSDLEFFLTTKKIPWGVIKKLEEDSVRSTEEAMNLDNSISSFEKYEDYNVLPVVFDSGSSIKTSLTKDVNFPFVVYTSSHVTTNHSFPLWVKYDIRSNESFNEESIYACTCEDDSLFSVATVSEYWDSYIQDAYETAREEAAQ